MQNLPLLDDSNELDFSLTFTVMDEKEEKDESFFDIRERSTLSFT